MNDETGSKAGNNWADTAAKYKDQQVTSLNRTFNMASV